VASATTADWSADAGVATLAAAPAANTWTNPRRLKRASERASMRSD